MGPGILIKAILQGFFSLIVFGWSQVLMDIQPLLAMLTGKGELHGFSHTYIGATLIAVFCALTGRWIYKVSMKMCRQNFTEYQKKLFAVSGNLTTSVCITSAFIGTISHVLLDSIMHGDVEPFYPIIPTNHLHLLLSIEGLYALCVYAGIAGTVIYLAIRSRYGIHPRS